MVSLYFFLIPTFYCVLGVVLYYTDWAYFFYSILIIAVVFALSSASIIYRRPFRDFQISSLTLQRTLAIIYLFFSLGLSLYQGLHFSEEGLALDSLQIVLVLNLFVSTFLFLLMATPLFKSKYKAQLTTFIALAGMMLLLTAKSLVPLASPEPFIDVWTICSAAADHLLSGQNPYPIIYPDIYSGYFDYAPTLPYWPGLLPWISAAKLFLEEIRYAFIFNEIITACCLFLLARGLKLPLHLGLLLPLLWLSFPNNLFILEQSWNEPIIIMWLALLCLALFHGKIKIAAVLLGLFCSVKAYIVFIPFLTALWIYKNKGMRTALIFSAIAALTYILVLSPFALADWQSLYQYTFLQPLQMAPRWESLSFFALIHNEFGITLPAKVTILPYLLAFAGIALWLWRQDKPLSLQTLIGSWFLICGVVFLFGKVAFSNYYYFLAFLSLVYMVLQIGNSLPPRTHSERAPIEPAEKRPRHGMAKRTKIALLIILNLIVLNVPTLFRLAPHDYYHQDRLYQTGYFTGNRFKLPQLYISLIADEGYYYEWSTVVLGKTFEPEYPFSDRIIWNSPVREFFAQKPQLRIPYRDIALEYPPLLIAPILSARLMSHDYLSYARSLALLISLAFLICLGIIYRIRQKMPAEDRVSWPLILFSCAACIVGLGMVFVTRLDIFPALLYLLALWAFLDKRYYLSTIWIVLGFFTKGYSLLLAPLFGLVLLYRKKYRELAICALLTLFLVSGVSLLLGYASEGVYWDSFTFHSERGIEIGSLYALIPYFLKVSFDAPSVAYWAPHSLDIRMPETTLLLSLANNLPLVVLTILYGLIWKFFHNMRHKELPPYLLVEAALLLVFAFMITFKVLSPQFLIWLIPLIFLMKPKHPLLFFLIFISLTYLTQILFPILFFQYLGKLHPLGFFVLLIRNLGLLALFVWLCHDWFVRTRLYQSRSTDTALARS